MGISSGRYIGGNLFCPDGRKKGVGGMEYGVWSMEVLDIQYINAGFLCVEKGKPKNECDFKTNY